MDRAGVGSPQPASLAARQSVPSSRRRWPLGRRLSSIIAVQNDIMGAMVSREELLNLIARKCESLTAADGATVELMEQGALVYGAVCGMATPLLGKHMSIEGSLSGLSVTSSSVQISNDTLSDARVDGTACARIGARSILVAPLRADGEVVGVLKVMSREVNAFDADDTQTLELCAGLIGAGIARCAEFDATRRLIELRERLAAEREAKLHAVEERNALLRAIFDATSLLKAIVEPEANGLRFVAANQALARMLGHPNADIAGRRAVELGWSEHNAAILLAQCEEALSSGKAVEHTFLCRASVEERALCVTLTHLPLANAYSGPSRSLIPVEADHPFRSKPNRIPEEAEQRSGPSRTPQTWL